MPLAATPTGARWTISTPDERITTMAETTSKTKIEPAPKTETVTAPAAPAAQANPIPMRDGRIVPTPGDVRTEPVATAAQSHVAGRVGPATVPEDATSVQPAGDSLDEVMPGTVLADTPEGTGPVPVELPEDPQGEALNRLAERVEAERDAPEANPHGTARP